MIGRTKSDDNRPLHCTTCLQWYTSDDWIIFRNLYRSKLGEADVSVINEIYGMDGLEKTILVN